MYSFIQLGSKDTQDPKDGYGLTFVADEGAFDVMRATSDEMVNHLET